jgi:hypothetical protein
MADDALKVAQLVNEEKSINLIAGGSKNRPMNIEPGSADWQKWAIQALCELTANGEFQGRDIVAAIPARDVFIEHAKIPKIKDDVRKAMKSFLAQSDKLQDVIISKIKPKLPFEPDDAVIKYIPTEGDNILVMAVQRNIVDRHLAIYENANFQIKSIAVWPTALTTSYTSFFGRRKTDIEAIVMLTCIEPDCTNVVISRHKDLLLARSIPIGAKQLNRPPESDKGPVQGQSDEMMTRLVLELTACKRQLGSTHRNAQIERLIFLANQVVDKNICETIAKKLEMPAQMGDCLAAVEISDPYSVGIDRRDCKVNWATAFGLSLS